MVVRLNSLDAGDSGEAKIEVRVESDDDAGDHDMMTRSDHEVMMISMTR